MTPLEVALSYAAKGWPTFPCRRADEDVVIDRETGEVETYRVKSPLTPRGLKDASVKPNSVNAWFGRKCPDSMIGIPTGEPIGAWVLDIDVPPNHEDGRLWLAEMEVLHGPIPKTLSATTPSGGRHYFWKYKEGIRNKAAIGPGADIRSTGGYVIGAGSVMADGSAYTWDNECEIAEAPEWMLSIVLPKAPTHRPTSSAYTHSAGENARYVERAIELEMELLASTSEGGRGEQANKSAYKLGNLVGAGVLSRHEAENHIFNAAIANGSVQTDGEREIHAKIRRGLDAGIRMPRNIPESNLNYGDNTKRQEVDALIRSGLAKGHQVKPKEWGAKDAAPDELIEPDPEVDMESDDDTHGEEVESNASIPEEDRDLQATPFTWIDPTTIPRRQFAFGTHYIRKYVSVTVSPGGLGKTSNSIVEALAMASGKPLNGIKPPQRMRVWLFNAEDPRDELERRIMAACLHFKLKPADIEGHLFLDTGREKSLVVAIDNKKGIVIQPIVQTVAKELADKRIDVMIVDPFVSTHQVNENDNGAIDAVAKLWASLADKANCAVDIVHHLRKVADREGTVEDARGAVSLIGAARSVRVLNRMSEEAAKSAGVSKEERQSIFSITCGKSNLTPTTGASDWRKLVGVPLGNHGKGNFAHMLQDHAPVVTYWKWPTAAELVEEVPDDSVKLLRARVGGQTCTYNYQSKDWVGFMVADILRITIPESKKKTPEHAKIERMIDAWLADGTLRKEEITGVDLKHPARITTYIRAG